MCFVNSCSWLLFQLWCLPDQVSGLSFSTFQAVVWYLITDCRIQITPSAQPLVSCYPHRCSFSFFPNSSSVAFLCMAVAISTDKPSCCFYKPCGNHIGPKCSTPSTVFFSPHNTSASLTPKHPLHACTLPANYMGVFFLCWSLHMKTAQQFVTDH